jgi:hypothetical protein
LRTRGCIAKLSFCWNEEEASWFFCLNLFVERSSSCAGNTSYLACEEAACSSISLTHVSLDRHLKQKQLNKLAAAKPVRITFGFNTAKQSMDDKMAVILSKQQITIYIRRKIVESIGGAYSHERETY